MECLHCKGRMEKGTAPFSVDRHGYHVRWDAIAAWVCTQCGRPFFEAHEVEQIERALEALDRANEQLATVIADGETEAFDTTPEEERELLESIREADRGEVITAEDVLARLRR